jgi:hypothetical protein
MFSSIVYCYSLFCEKRQIKDPFENQFTKTDKQRDLDELNKKERRALDLFKKLKG